MVLAHEVAALRPLRAPRKGREGIPPPSENAQVDGTLRGRISGVLAQGGLVAHAMRNRAAYRPVENPPVCKSALCLGGGPRAAGEGITPPCAGHHEKRVGLEEEKSVFSFCGVRKMFGSRTGPTSTCVIMGVWGVLHRYCKRVSKRFSCASKCTTYALRAVDNYQQAVYLRKREKQHRDNNYYVR